MGVILRRALFGVGPVATGRAAIKRLLGSDAELGRAAGPGRPDKDPFDLEFGTDTGGFLSWRELQNGGANDAYTSGYLAIAPSVARRLLRLVANPAEHVFIDLGCGKGRATVLASELPFRRVIGVEIAAQVVTAARGNAEIIARRYPWRPPIEIAHCDAATFELPEQPLVIFMYQPFERPVMRQVVSRLTKSLRAAPRPVTLIYVNPALARMFDRSPLFERVLADSYALQEAEIPFSYGGTGGADSFVVWRTTFGRDGS